MLVVDGGGSKRCGLVGGNLAVVRRDQRLGRDRRLRLHPGRRRAGRAADRRPRARRLPAQERARAAHRTGRPAGRLRRSHLPRGRLALRRRRRRRRPAGGARPPADLQAHALEPLSRRIGAGLASASTFGPPGGGAMRQRGCSLVVATLGLCLLSLVLPMSAAAAPPPTRTTLDPAVAIPGPRRSYLFELTRTSEPPRPRYPPRRPPRRTVGTVSTRPGWIRRCACWCRRSSSLRCCWFWRER